MYFMQRHGGPYFLCVAEASANDPASWTVRPERILPEGEAGAEWPHVVRVGDEWRMYYASTGGPGLNTMQLATSSDGLHWRRISTRPLIEHGPPGAWDSEAIGSCAVWPHEGGWTMLYTGGTVQPRRACLGLAFSPDGVQWTKHDANPVLEPGPGDIIASKPALFASGQRVELWFSAYNAAYRLRHAISDDGGKTWKRTAAAIDPAPHTFYSQSVSYPSVMHDGPRLRLWFCGNGLGDSGIGFAELKVSPTAEPEPPR